MFDLSEFILHFAYEKANTLYTWSTGMDSFGNFDPGRVPNIIRSAMLVNELNKDGDINLHQLFIVSFFFDEKYDYNFFAFKIKGEDNMYFIDQKLNMFKSLEETLSYLCGSTENYIETYKYRFLSRKQNTSRKNWDSLL